MKEITFYRTYSYGGMEGRTEEVRNFETVELAVEDALKDTWNEQFKLYKVKMIFDGKITLGQLISFSTLSGFLEVPVIVICAYVSVNS